MGLVVDLESGQSLEVLAYADERSGGYVSTEFQRVEMPHYA
jgi:hypothetical protein